MKGKELKILVDKYLQSSGVPVLEFIDKSGIQQRTYYRLFDRTNDIPEHYLTKLELAGLKLPKNDNKVNFNENAHYEKEIIELLKEQNSELKHRIKELDTKNKQDAFSKSTLLSALEKLSTQVESLNGIKHLILEALETGALKKKSQ